MRVRLPGVVVVALAIALVVGLASPGSAEPVPKPTRAQLTKAMLTLPQITRQGLDPVSGPGATYSGDFDPSLRFTTYSGQIHSFTFADSTSRGRKDQRSVMIDVAFGRKPAARVQCRIDEGSPQVRVSADACVSVRRPSGGDVAGVSYGIKPAPGVTVIAYVSDDPISTSPRWAVPSTARLTAAAKALALAQVARLRAQGLIPAR